MARSVFTIPRPPGAIVVGSDADRSYPAAYSDPRTGNIALGDNFFTRSDGASLYLLVAMADDILLLLLLLLFSDEDEKSKNVVDRDLKNVLVEAV
jgi:hypothetical protein